MTMLILWSFVFLSFFIRSVLQLATRIKFNKRFNDARTRKESKPVRMLPTHLGVPIFDIGLSGCDLNAHIKMMNMASTSTPEVSDLSTAGDQNQEVDEIQEAPAPSTSVAVNSNRLTLERLENLRPSSSKQIQEDAGGNLPRRRYRNRGRLIKALQVLIDPNAPTDEVEPLTLANPVSEILKVMQLSFPLPPLQCCWVFNADSRQLPASDGSCCFHQCGLGEIP